MRRFLSKLIVLGLIAVAIGLWITRPQTVSEERFAALTPDATRGEAVFWAAGCASCHKGEDSENSLELPGGHRLASPFGTFIAPNISTDPENGIGRWTQLEFASAVLNGTSPDGSHYYPSFPYTSYAKMTDADVADLWAFMQTLPAVPQESQPHELGFPFNIRLSLGGWKLLFLKDDFVTEADTPELERGRYLVEALGHCTECHTPRNAIGGLEMAKWMDGAPIPGGKGKTPGITPAHLDWSATDIAYYLETGFTPDFDSAGGEMAAVVQNTAKLSPEDRAAIAAYVKALP